MCADQEIFKAFKVHGMVQGVGFRFWAHREGRRLALRGIVRNCYDGTVEIAFAGSPDAVQAMSERLETGPPGAHVVCLEELPPPDELPGDFQIGF